MKEYEHRTTHDTQGACCKVAPVVWVVQVNAPVTSGAVANRENRAKKMRVLALNLI